MATAAVTEAITGDIKCYDIAGNAKDCALDCLNPFNWGGKSTLKNNVIKWREKGGLNLFKRGKESTTKADGWKDGDFMLHLPDKRSTKANWKQNSGHLREQVNKGNPIYDSYRDPKTGRQIETGGFLNAERKFLESRGWQYSPSTGAYHPPN